MGHECSGQLPQFSAPVFINRFIGDQERVGIQDAQATAEPKASPTTKERNPFFANIVNDFLRLTLKVKLSAILPTKWAYSATGENHKQEYAVPRTDASEEGHSRVPL